MTPPRPWRARCFEEPVRERDRSQAVPEGPIGRVRCPAFGSGSKRGCASHRRDENPDVLAKLLLHFFDESLVSTSIVGPHPRKIPRETTFRRERGSNRVLKRATPRWSIWQARSAELTNVASTRYERDNRQPDMVGGTSGGRTDFDRDHERSLRCTHPECVETSFSSNGARSQGLGVFGQRLGKLSGVPEAGPDSAR